MAIEIETVERSFPVLDTGDLVLSNIAGTVEIRGWDHAEITVKATKRPGGWMPWGTPEDVFRTTHVEIEQQGQRVTARTSRQRDSGLPAILQWLGGVAQVDYVVRVPRNSNVVVDLVSGRLTIEDVQGNLIVRTVSARQDLRNLTGNLVISTVSGGVAADGLKGKASIRTVSGGVRVTRGQLESLSGRSVSGGMDIETPLDPSGAYDFESVSGGVRLAVPESTGLSAEHQSLSGWLRSDLPADIQELRRGQWRAEVGGGGTRVRLKSVSAGLRIGLLVGPPPLAPGAESGSATEAAWVAAAEATQASVARPVAEEPPKQSSDELQGPRVDREALTMMILEAVQRGELTVEEAGKRLEQLDSLTQAEGHASPPQAGKPGSSGGSNG
jgi:Putative adhesin